ncbi:glycosyltransferase family 4 protein [Halopenitus salinus]|jgi:glycosyltransferase involved in cell wall biosynthesis|uniref:Glycosyltransferase family 4 protein n=1 Tax=Halopenitus salinus TaxID=1198295 RepID=A0ABD5UNI8_9EURY
MRVAFVSLFTPHHGETPARSRTHRIARQLADRGHEVRWLCAQWWGGDHDSFEDEGIGYRRVVADPDPARFAARLPAALRRASPDVVHATNSPPGGALAATATRLFHRAPVLVDWWRDHPADSPISYRLLARGADGIVVPSETARTRLLEYGTDAEATTIIPESIDFGLVESADVDDRFDVVYSRRLDRDANVESFLLALAELRTREWRAAVIGDGPERRAAEETASDLRIDDRVTFLGETPIDERVSVFKGAHVAVQTATREAFASDLLWALACGCVGLVEYQAGSSAHEIAEARERARLVTSPQEIADAFLEAGSMSRRAVDDRFESYDRRPILERYLERYRSLLDARGKL